MLLLTVESCEKRVVSMKYPKVHTLILTLIVLINQVQSASLYESDKVHVDGVHGHGRI